jgi:hypothetical protein
MPSLIGADAGSGVNVAANYLKAVESTNFATRGLRFIKVTSVHSAAAVDFSKATIGATGVYTTSNSIYQKGLNALMGFVEVYASFAPGTGGFIVAIADDTTNDGNQGGQNPNASVTNSPFTAAAAAVKAAIGADTSVTIATVAVAATGITIS